MSSWQLHNSGVHGDNESFTFLYHMIWRLKQRYFYVEKKELCKAILLHSERSEIHEGRYLTQQTHEGEARV